MHYVRKRDYILQNSLWMSTFENEQIALNHAILRDIFECLEFSPRKLGGLSIDLIYIMRDLIIVEMSHIVGHLNQTSRLLEYQSI